MQTLADLLQPDLLLGQAASDVPRPASLHDWMAQAAAALARRRRHERALLAWAGLGLVGVTVALTPGMGLAGGLGGLLAALVGLGGVWWGHRAIDRAQRAQQALHEASLGRPIAQAARLHPALKALADEVRTSGVPVLVADVARLANQPA